VALVAARGRVEDDDAVVDVAVGDEELVRSAIDEHVCGRAEILRVSLLPVLWPCRPICSTNLPARVNFRICESFSPPPETQTWSVWSTWMPCSRSGHS
jgi:hypothetical protein